MNIYVDFTISEHCLVYDANIKLINKSNYFIDHGYRSLIYRYEDGEILAAEINGEIVLNNQITLPITDIDFVSNLFPRKVLKSSAAYSIPGL